MILEAFSNRSDSIKASNEQLVHLQEIQSIFHINTFIMESVNIGVTNCSLLICLYDFSCGISVQQRFIYTENSLTKAMLSLQANKASKNVYIYMLTLSVNLADVDLDCKIPSLGK